MVRRYIRDGSGERKIVQHRGFSARYVAAPGGAGHLIYLHHSTLFAAPFDLRGLALTDSPIPVLEDAGSSLNGAGDFAFSQTGTFVYLAGRTAPTYAIQWLDSSGKTQPLHAQPAAYVTPRFSPDGKRLAFATVSGQASDIWVKDLERDTASRLTFLPGNNNWPVWTPDGQNIVFLSFNPNGQGGLYWIPADGSGQAQRLTDGAPYSFSPDGKRLAFSSKSDIFTAVMEGDPAHPRLGSPELFLGTRFTETHPSFSPDGRLLAYTSNESGTWEVYVRPFPGPGGRWQISTGGGRFPAWSRTARELFFQSLDGRIMIVSYIAESGSFKAGKPRLWSQTRVRVSGGQSTYDLAPDGKRCAVLAPDDTGGENKPLRQVTFLLNFFDELQRSMPAGK